MVQFAACSVLNGMLMFIFETPAWEQITASLLPLLYLGIMSSGVAYTLQIMGQKYISSVIACMLMSLESAFALISGWLFWVRPLPAGKSSAACWSSPPSRWHRCLPRCCLAAKRAPEYRQKMRLP